MDYELAFEFDNGDVVRHVHAERIVEDPRNEVARVDIPFAQRIVPEDQMIDLARRVQAETPKALLMAGDGDGMFMVEQTARVGGNVLLRFSSANAEEEAYIDGSCLIF